MKKLGIITTLLSLAAFSYGETTDCANLNIENVYVEGKRDDGYFLESKLVLILSEECDGTDMAFAELDNPAYQGFLSIALSAKAMGLSVNVAVNNLNKAGSANELAYIGY